MRIPSTALDNGERCKKLSFQTPTGQVVLGEEVLVEECAGLSRSTWKGILESIGTPFCTVSSYSVSEGNIRKITNYKPH